MGASPDRIMAAQGRAAAFLALAGSDGLCHALGEPARLAILGALRGEALTVSELAQVIHRKVPATSQHLRVLRSLGLVAGERRGTTVAYQLTPGPLAQHLAVLLAVLESTGRLLHHVPH